MPEPVFEREIPEPRLRELMCDVGRRMWQRQFCAANDGNLCARIDDQRVLITPTGISKGFLDPDDLCVVNLADQVVASNARRRTPTSERRMHLAILRKRPDVVGVVHAHAPHATVYAIVNKALPEAMLAEAESLLGHVPVAPYALPGTDQLPANVVSVIREDTRAVLMANHGAVTFGKSLLDAYYTMEVLDSYCRIAMMVQQVGGVRALSRDEFIALLEQKVRAGLPDERLASLKAQASASGEPA